MLIVNVNSDTQLQRYNRLIKTVPSIVLFYADWCGHCNNFKPEWKKFERLAKQQHHANDFMIARVNDNYIRQIEGHSKVDGYPTVYHLINGKHNKSFSNSRDLKGLIDFLSDVHPGMRSLNGGAKKTLKKRKNKSRNNKKGGKIRTRTAKRGGKSKATNTKKNKKQKKETLIHRLLRYELLF